MDIIEVKNISKKFKNLQAVKNLTFPVKKGEIFGLLGPNGAGKTTTIRILTAQIRPDEGYASVLGFDVTREQDQVHKNIGVVFEDQNFYPRLSVEQNLKFFASLQGKGDKDVLRALEYVKLDHCKKEEAQKLSRGFKQRLLVARALLHDPEIVFLDEPTVGLDPHIARDIRSIFKELKQRGKTIFLTTHYMEEADELCDRVAIMNEGSIVKLDTPENLKDSIGHSEITIRIFSNDESSFTTTSFPSHNLEGMKLLEKLISEGVKFKLDTKKASLEDVFIELTGAKLDIN